MLLLKVVFFSIVYHSTSSSTSLFHPLYFITLSPSSPIQFIILFCHHCHDLLATQTRSLSPRSEVFYRAGTSPIWLASIRHFDVWWQLLFDSSPNQQTHHTDSQTGFFLQGTTLVTGSSFLPWHVWAETVTQSSSQKGVPARSAAASSSPSRSLHAPTNTTTTFAVATSPQHVACLRGVCGSRCQTCFPDLRHSYSIFFSFPSPTLIKSPVFILLCFVKRRSPRTFFALLERSLFAFPPRAVCLTLRLLCCTAPPYPYSLVAAPPLHAQVARYCSPPAAPVPVPKKEPRKKTGGE